MSIDGQINNIAKDNKNSDHDELKELMKKNIELSEKVLELTEKNHHILFMARVWGFVKVFIILIPIILGIIYLPPMLEKIYIYYQDLLGIGDSMNKFNPANLKEMGTDFFNKSQN